MREFAQAEVEIHISRPRKGVVIANAARSRENSIAIDSVSIAEEVWESVGGVLRYLFFQRLGERADAAEQLIGRAQ